jgi:predicted O-methyltransferase YrrM
VGPLGNAAEYVADYAAGYVSEDEPLLFARANALDLGGTEPVRPAVGAALRFIASAVSARAAVEIGTGCGSSGIWLLRGMRQSGTLTTVDTEPEYQRMARQAFTRAGFAANQSRLILGRARDVLPRLSDGAYAIVFCDADPREHPDFLADVVRLLRPGAVAVFNDALSGTPDRGDPDLASIVREDEHLVPMLLPLGDGLLAAVKRAL